MKQPKGSVVEMDSEGLNANINGDIRFNATGEIKIKGERIDLN